MSDRKVIPLRRPPQIPTPPAPINAEWLAETWRLIGIGAMPGSVCNVVLSPAGCRALLAEREEMNTNVQILIDTVRAIRNDAI